MTKQGFFLVPRFIQSQVLARDARHVTTGAPDQYEAAGGEEMGDGFVMVQSKVVQPLDFFTIAGVDVAVATVPVGWQRCPDMVAVLEMRLEADTSRGSAGAVFGPGALSTRSCEVRKQVRTPQHTYIPDTYWQHVRICSEGYPSIPGNLRTVSGTPGTGT